MTQSYKTKPTTKTRTPVVLLLDTDALYRDRVREALEATGCEVLQTSLLESALAACFSRYIDLFVAEVVAIGSKVEDFRSTAAVCPQLPILLTIDTACEYGQQLCATIASSFPMELKPADPVQLAAIIRSLLTADTVRTGR